MQAYIVDSNSLIAQLRVSALLCVPQIAIAAGPASRLCLSLVLASLPLSKPAEQGRRSLSVFPTRHTHTHLQHARGCSLLQVCLLLPRSRFHERRVDLAFSRDGRPQPGSPHCQRRQGPRWIQEDCRCSYPRQRSLKGVVWPPLSRYRLARGGGPHEERKPPQSLCCHLDSSTQDAQAKR